jgi:hypothetical protein
MPTSVRQVSFAGGEISPTLHGRSDLAKYHVSLRRMRNFFPSRQGVAVSRPGTTFVREVKTSANGKVRLIPFIYSDTQAYVLEFGNGYIRFHRNGATILSGGVPYEVSTSYATADLPKLQVAQVGKVLSITHSSYAPTELTWGGTDTSWTLSSINFTRPNALTIISLSPYMLEPLPTATAAEPGLEWTWKITALIQNTSGIVIESLPLTITSSSPDGIVMNGFTGLQPVYLDKAQTLKWTVSAVQVGLNPVYGYRIYRGRNGVMGLIGQYVGNAVSGGSFVDRGDAPDYTQQPPVGQSPFTTGTNDVAFGGHRIKVQTNDYPGIVCFFEERRTFAGMASRRETLLASLTGDYYDFDTRQVPTESSPLNFELAAHRAEDIRSLVAHAKLLVLTSSSVWAGGGVGGPLSFDNVDFKRQDSVGSAWIQPLLIDGTVLFVRTKGTGVRGLLHDPIRETYTAQDLSMLASHLFVGHSVTDWAYAEDPWSLVWAVREDGTLLSFTYVRDQEVWAWAWHDTSGTYESVCVVPEGLEDVPYFVVARTIGGVTKRYLERAATRVITTTNLNQAVCLDCAVVYSGAATTAISGLSHLEGQAVYALADGNVQGPFTVASGAITLTLAASYVVAGLVYTPELEQLDLAIGGVEVKTREKQVVRVGLEVDNSRGLSLGADFDNLKELKQRQVSDSYSSVALGSALYRMSVLGKWTPDGRVALRQTQPLPVTVLSITREVEFGDS